MKHKWEKLNDDYQIERGHFKRWKCKVCGCIKYLSYSKFAEPMYVRNGQIRSKYVECIDEEFEKTKTID